jgi:hypothetical protein
MSAIHEARLKLRAELEGKRVQHYSVFALAPIPVLVSLGRELGNKINVDLLRKGDRIPVSRLVKTRDPRTSSASSRL